MEVPVQITTTKTLHPLRIRLTVHVEEVAGDTAINQRTVDQFRIGLEDLVRMALREYGVALTSPKTTVTRDPALLTTTLVIDIEYALINEPAERGKVIKIAG